MSIISLAKRITKVGISLRASFPFYVVVRDTGDVIPIRVNEIQDLARALVEQVESHRERDKAILESNREYESRIAELEDALRPFTAMHDTGWVGSILEGKDDNTDVLYHHASQTMVTLGDFARARRLVPR